MNPPWWTNTLSIETNARNASRMLAGSFSTATASYVRNATPHWGWRIVLNVWSVCNLTMEGSLTQETLEVLRRSTTFSETMRWQLQGAWTCTDSKEMLTRDTSDIWKLTSRGTNNSSITSLLKILDLETTPESS